MTKKKTVAGKTKKKTTKKKKGQTVDEFIKATKPKSFSGVLNAPLPVHLQPPKKEWTAKHWKLHGPSPRKAVVIWDRLNRVLADGDLFVYVSEEGIVRTAQATITPSGQAWFSVLYTDECLLWGREYYKLPPPLEKFFILRETHDLDEIKSGTFIILKEISMNSSFYGKFW